jgi:hypothetical protein
LPDFFVVLKNMDFDVTRINSSHWPPGLPPTPLFATSNSARK